MRYRIPTINLDIGPSEAFRDAAGNSYGPDWTSKVGPEHLAAIGMEAYEPAVSPPLPPPVPDITPRQLWLALMGAGFITPAEADAASLGTIPTFLNDVIETLSTETERVAARVTIRTALSIERDNPLVIAALSNLPTPPSAAEVDDFFRQASSL